jgi:hypothetical protein
MERISGLEELNTNFLSGANQLSIETGKRHAFVHSQIQISSIVNGEAMLICQRENSVIGRRLAQPHVQLIQRKAIVQRKSVLTGLFGEAVNQACWQIELDSHNGSLYRW